MPKISVYAASAAALLLAGAANDPAGAASYSFRLLYTFCSAQNCADGSAPQGGVVLDAKGNVFGTTQNGGANGEGTVFEVTTGGKEIVRHAFAFSDGAFPAAGLVIDKSGDLFGTTQQGGPNNGGTVFELPAKGSLKTVASLQFSQRPEAAVVMDASGNLFGTSSEGGANGGGAVFEITKKGQEQTLYSFCAQSDCADGKTPLGSLILDKHGNFYGTVSEGGGAGQGAVFELESAGKYKLLCDFLATAKCTAGAVPKAGLAMDKKGNLYGTTSGGGSNSNRGTVFALSSKGAEKILYNFCAVSGCTDGYFPQSQLVADNGGTFYGTTPLGGKQQSGTVFSVTPKGKLTVIYNFCEAAQCADGSDPVAVTLDAKGNIYGTTRSGGGHGAGTVFELVKR